ncbi:DUF4317 domain-containing protein [Clostridium sp. MSJ-4]|uniref:DUF4317 domain-containing protein n=1 Tax=Clostridium simiarum TaxID=2841506 RepID=A0ABS6F2Z7_9CLOT|nr:DUF4317 family protein [Clostridium simiarum]MBU5592849.1 DUF4317 domain-containing protein [Clostridium simiarum]
MDKKQIASIKKNISSNGKLLQLEEIYSCYVKKDTGKVIYSEKKHFNTLEEEVEKLYINNFKKILTGNIDEKIFQLDFVQGQELSTQNVLLDILNEDINEENMESLIKKIYENCIYETDITINILKGKYTIDKNSSLDENPNFIIVSINRVVPPKKSLKFDHSSKTFKESSNLDVIVDLNSPIQGFLYPLLEVDGDNLDRILYYNGKMKALDESFIKWVLNCEAKSTLSEDKENFLNIIKFSAKEGLKISTLKNLYEFIDEQKENGEEALTIRDILPFIEEESNLGEEELINMGKNLLPSEDYSFNINSILPDIKSKSLKIENEYLTINISPSALNKIKQNIGDDGKRYLMISMDEKPSIGDIEIRDDEGKEIIEDLNSAIDI